MSILGQSSAEKSDGTREYLLDDSNYASLQPDKSVEISIVHTEQYGPLGVGIHYGPNTNDMYVAFTPIAQLIIYIIGKSDSQGGK